VWCLVKYRIEFLARYLVKHRAKFYFIFRYFTQTYSYLLVHLAALSERHELHIVEWKADNSYEFLNTCKEVDYRILRFCRNICLEQLRKTVRNLSQDFSLRAENRTWQLWITRYEY